MSGFVVSSDALTRRAWTDTAPGAYSPSGRVKVEWVDLGEGTCGDYNPDDPYDVALLRWDAYIYCPNPDVDPAWGMSLEAGFNSPWCAPYSDSSFCTQVPVGTPRDRLLELAEHIADELDDAIDAGGWKHTAQRLSWLDG